MTAKRQLLSNAVFGRRVAEDEIDELHSYFVETEQWRKVIAGEVDIVFGAKGAGKSALYSLLVAQQEQLRLGRRTLFLAAENPRGAPAFRDLHSALPLSEDEFRNLWKLYFLCLAADYLRRQLAHAKKENCVADEALSILTSNGLLAPNVTLLSRLMSVINYIQKILPEAEAAISDANSGIQFRGKLKFREPTTEERNLGYRTVDDLLALVNLGLADERITTWLALDRLDVAFSDSPELEGNALRALFRAYIDMLGLSQIKIKIFLRDDIWHKIVAPGFREASHITKTLSLTWDHGTLLNLLVRRLAANDAICDAYNIDRDELLSSSDRQEKFFYAIFPDQVDSGVSKSKTLDWMLTRTADGSKRTAPRELIHLLLETRDEQMKLYQLGGSEPEEGRLFTKAAIRSGLPAVSKARYFQTLCAEHPSLRAFLDRLDREKTAQSKETLAKLWKCSIDRSVEIAEQLIEVGFFERRGSKEEPTYWVPFLYRDAINMVQGTA